MTEKETSAVMLSGRLNRMTADQAVKLVRELCSQLVGDSDSFHGAIWPGNIRLDWEDNGVLGENSDQPVAQRDADEVEFLAPEYFWDSAKSAAADVYSLGLILYAGCNRGRMPFQAKNKALTDKDRSSALRRRMKGETFTMPGNISPELSAVIAKALAYDPEKRFISAAELLSALNETQEALPPAEEAPAEAAGETVTAAAPVEEDTVPAPMEEAVESADVPSPEETLTETPDANPEVPAVEPLEITPDAEADTTPEAVVPVTETKKYTVRKDFEENLVRSRSAVPASRRRKKRVSPLIPILCILAVGIILVVALTLALGAVNDNEKTVDISPSEAFIINASELEQKEEEGASEKPAESADADADAETTEGESDAESADSEEESLGSSSIDGTAVEPANDTVYVTESGAKLRQGPGTSYDVADSLPRGTALERTGTVEGWSQVQYNGGEYYIANTLITDINPSGAEAEEDETDSTSSGNSIGTLKVASEANIRAGAGTGYNILGVVKVGTKLTVLDVTSDGKWYQVSYNGGTGYINRNMVTVEELDYSATATVISDVNVRAGAGTSYSKLGVAKTGESLTVIGITSGNWYKISYNGQTGYVAGNYVTIR